MWTRRLVVAMVLLAPAPAAAEWQIRPFIGFTFAGSTTFVDPETAAGQQNLVLGISGGWLGEVFGFEGDFGRVPGFFQVFDRDSSESLVIDSGLTTLTGNIVIALPRRMSEFGLRPYFVGGAGLIDVHLLGRLGGVEINRTLPAMDIGGGVTGFLTNSIGLNWDIRRFSTLRGEGESIGNSIGREQLSFWRATMAVAVRY